MNYYYGTLYDGYCSSSFNNQLVGPYYNSNHYQYGGTHTACTTGYFHMAVVMYDNNGGYYTRDTYSSATYPTYTYENYHIDTALPVTTITSPASGSTQTASFAVSYTDSDATPTAGLIGCYYDVYDNGTQTVSYGSRTCGSSFSTITVGA